MTFTAQQIRAGHAAFTRTTLPFYDRFVLGLTCGLLWRCPTSRTLDFYGRHLSGNHLEVGVGTGFFLDRGRFPVAAPRLALLDANEQCLAYTARRVARYAPRTYCANVLAPIDIDAPGFDSIALNYVLHCLPGALPDKGAALMHLAKLLNPGGVLFGSALLYRGTPMTPVARTFMRFYNAQGTLCNLQDDLLGLTTALQRNLRDVRIEIVGCVAMFSGRAKD